MPADRDCAAFGAPFAAVLVEEAEEDLVIRFLVHTEIRRRHLAYLLKGNFIRPSRSLACAKAAEGQQARLYAGKGEKPEENRPGLSGWRERGFMTQSQSSDVDYQLA
ncbi:Hypothetical protein GbCGDNIH9_8406 [Granulibacter bethesdensis]|uniref:Uncharacterized protein n=1 Tax=Granulibacter bethesdensis TaxID=364410 RepID=A0AAC9KB90_9PROT|nr:Hypothetical protein GbCGDNIH9_8406 [Granulibacter bethesdensis]APH61165.1 Hypothetical protein GbCGDNIH8_8406 [Granulibacter bethesdensis]